MKLAPIALFVYNRPETLKKTLESLKKNILIEKTEIYIFSDGPTKSQVDIKKVKRVRKIIENTKNLKIKKKFFFKKNKGLKNNIINGINYVFKKNSKIIVLEDDLLVSPNFIQYMNQSLDFIKKNNKIWHVSAWNYPIKSNFRNFNNSFLWNHMNCWGWGTHKKYWKKLILNPNFFIRNFSNKQIYHFNLEGKINNWSQLIRNYEKKLDTWAIFWNATIFWNKALCLNPITSYVKNIGFDKDSTNTSSYIAQSKNLNLNKRINFPNNQKIDKFVIKKIKSHLFQRNKIDILKNLVNKII